MFLSLTTTRYLCNKKYISVDSGRIVKVLSTTYHSDIDKESMDTLKGKEKKRGKKRNETKQNKIK